jgi:hypothetical protein
MIRRYLQLYDQLISTCAVHHEVRIRPGVSWLVM